MAYAADFSRLSQLARTLARHGVLGFGGDDGNAVQADGRVERLSQLLGDGWGVPEFKAGVRLPSPRPFRR